MKFTRETTSNDNCLVLGGKWLRLRAKAPPHASVERKGRTSGGGRRPPTTETTEEKDDDEDLKEEERTERTQRRLAETNMEERKERKRREVTADGASAGSKVQGVRGSLI